MRDGRERTKGHGKLDRTRSQRPAVPLRPSLGILDGGVTLLFFPPLTDDDNPEEERKVEKKKEEKNITDIC